MNDQIEAILDILDTKLGEQTSFIIGILGREIPIKSAFEYYEFITESSTIADRWGQRAEVELFVQEITVFEAFLGTVAGQAKKPSAATESELPIPAWTAELRRIYQKAQEKLSSACFHAKNPIAVLLADIHGDRTSIIDENIASTVRQYYTGRLNSKQPLSSGAVAATLSLIQVLQVLDRLGAINTDASASRQSASQRTEQAWQLASKNNAAIESLTARLNTELAERATAAPAEHWETQRRWHHEQAAVARWLMIGSIVATVGIGIGFSLWSARAARTIASDEVFSFTAFLQTQLPVWLLGGTLLGIGVWSVRFTARYYTSHAHMIRITREKTAMVKTFIELSSMKVIDPTQWGIILAAIFRDTPDGLVNIPDGPHSIADLVFATAATSAHKHNS